MAESRAEVAVRCGTDRSSNLTCCNVCGDLWRDQVRVVVSNLKTSVAESCTEIQVDATRELHRVTFQWLPVRTRNGKPLQVSRRRRDRYARRQRQLTRGSSTAESAGVWPHLPSGWQADSNTASAGGRCARYAKRLVPPDHDEQLLAPVSF